MLHENIGPIQAAMLAERRALQAKFYPKAKPRVAVLALPAPVTIPAHLDCDQVKVPRHRVLAAGDRATWDTRMSHFDHVRIYLHVLAGTIGGKRHRTQQIEADFLAVCPFHMSMIRVADSVPGSRRRHYVIWRQALMHALQHTGMSLPEIGLYFRGRDHTTVLHAIRRVDRAIQSGETETIVGPMGTAFHVRVK